MIKLFQNFIHCVLGQEEFRNGEHIAHKPSWRQRKNANRETIKLLEELRNAVVLNAQIEYKQEIKQ